MATHRIIRSRGQRIAYTNTSPIPDAEFRAAIKWLTREVDLDRTVIHFKRAGKHRRSYGRAYWVIPGVANLDGLRSWEWDYLITVTDGRDQRQHGSWRETLAHEAKHIEQAKAGRNPSEPPCVAFGKWAADRMP